MNSDQQDPKAFSLRDLFTDAQLDRAFKIIYEHGGTSGLNAMLIESVVREAMPNINEVTKQENNETYVAYLLQHAYNQAQRRAR